MLSIKPAVMDWTYSCLFQDDEMKSAVIEENQHDGKRDSQDFHVLTGSHRPAGARLGASARKHLIRTSMHLLTRMLPIECEYPMDENTKKILGLD